MYVPASEMIPEPERVIVAPTTDTPIEVNRVPSQQTTDLAYIQRLAQRNGFVFHIEPTLLLGESMAYWGPAHSTGLEAKL